MDIEGDYKRIRTFFISVVSITGVCVTIMAVFSFFDMHNLRQDYNDRLDRMEKQAKEQIEKTKIDSEIEIENIRQSVNITAQNEATNRINDIFKSGNIEKEVKDAASDAINKELDRLINNKIEAAKREIDEMFEANLKLSQLNQGLYEGAWNALKDLVKIRDESPNSPYGKQAANILRIRAKEFSEKFEKDSVYKNQGALAYFLYYQGIYGNEWNTKSPNFKLKLIEFMENDPSPEDAAVGFFVLKKEYGYPIEIFDFIKLREIKKGLK